MVSRKFKGIVFDLDGTLIHSTIDFRKMKRNMIKVLEENDVPNGVLTTTMITVDILEKAEYYWDLAEKPEEKRVELRAIMEEFMNQGELEAIPLVDEIEGASKALRELREQGYVLAILTRSHYEYAVEALKKIGAYDYFDVVLGRGQTPRPKPYPEALHHTAKLMGLDMDELLFVGDMHLDFESAINSGCAFIGVNTSGRGRRSWKEEVPDVLLENVAELPNYMSKP
ncbi:MAG: HAD family hydrolase [Chloroflexi bacterium]|nr:HAD family hydrolase [Chloroflexota bacterium]MBL7168600.1 HAD family hydrolase [Candidatus Bathyarchaeota archaeon]